MKSANTTIVAVLGGIAALDIGCAAALLITGQPWTVAAAIFTPIAVPIVGGLLVAFKGVSGDKPES